MSDINQRLTHHNHLPQMQERLALIQSIRALLAGHGDANILALIEALDDEEE